MKKTFLPFLLFIILMPFIVNAETCDTNKVKISSITIENKSINVEEIEEANANGKNINLNLSMTSIGDNIEYKIVVKNDSNEDYMFDKNSFNISSKYIRYTLKSEDNSDIIKANSNKTVHLKVEYINEVPTDSFKSGKYNDNKIGVINFSSDEEIKNPKTGNQSYKIIIPIILLVSPSIYAFLRKKKHTKIMMLIIGTALIVPIGVYSLCKSDIKIESNVEIKNNTFTGTLYRYNNIRIKNGSNISGYLLKSSVNYRNILYNSKDECSANAEDGEVCEKVQDSIFNYQGFYRSQESIDKNVYIRHDVVNNIIKNTYICYLDDSGTYCMQGGDNGNSFSSNEQIIKDFNQFHSYCSMYINEDRTGCAGSYGMEMNAYKNGAISAYYMLSMGCDVGSDSTSSCWYY